MKGIIFREFLEMVETQFGYDFVDEILVNIQLESNGIYTTVGTYNHNELFDLGAAVSNKSGIPLQQLFVLFGQHVFKIFTKSFGHLISPYKSPFDFLERIESTIHVEVLKLYPEAELPQFEIEEKTNDSITMIYTSGRKMADFAEGLIIGCLEHFETKAKIEKTDLAGTSEQVKFRIKRIQE